MRVRLAFSLCVLVSTPAGLLTGAKAEPRSPAPQVGAHAVYRLEPRPKVQSELQGILIQAVPGDVIELGAGLYQFDMDLSVTTSNVTIRGQGPDRTILSFKNQHSGSKGIEATGDNFVIENLAVEDTRGNAIKVVGAKNVTFRNVRTEWTGKAKTSNGAYGIYPVQCENVLVDGCVVRGASDAGVYVGQSRRIVVKNCRVERNVAGIEIENSFDADVFDNVATDNSGGILVFDLPGLEVHNGGRVRVFHNKVFKNNHANFGAPGSAVANVAPGTGLLLLAMDNVEIFENDVVNNQTCGLQVISYLITGNPITDPQYDPYPETAYIHDNRLAGGGTRPGGRLGGTLALLIGKPFPEIFYDGIVNPKKLVAGQLPTELGIRFERNGNVAFVNAHFDRLTPANIAAGKIGFDRDIAAYTGRFPPLPAVRLLPHAPPDRTSDPSAAIYRRAPARLSQFGLFRGSGRTQEPADRVVAYDVNTSLFADYAAKHRFVRLPPGTAARYREDDVFDFPIGTVIAKTFAYPRDMKEPAKGERLVETRIIEHKESGWYGYSYLWNDEQSEATLALGGGTTDVSWKHSDGSARSNDYIIPHANQCKSCHVAGGKTFLPLGLKARNLNKEFVSDGKQENQLARSARLQMLVGAPTSDRAPRVPCADDPASGTVETRTRAWLDVNCAHCHNPEGPARTTGVDLRWSQNNPARLGVWKSPVAAGHGSGPHRFDIVPGKPDESILVYRLESTEPGVMMPELPRRLVDEEGVALIREWIKQTKDPLKQAAAR